MNTKEKINKMVYQMRDMGEFKNITDYEGQKAFVLQLLTVARLARKHHRLAEMDCNGEGYIRGKFYRCDGSMPGAYVDQDTTIFTAEGDKVERKIEDICKRLGLRVEFQGDPRGYTVKVYSGDRFLDIQA